MNDVLSCYGGRPVVVTGCSSGIGAAVARALIAADAQVIGLDRNPPADDMHQFLSVDIGNLESITAAVSAISGPVWGLFNCAGVSSAVMDEQLVVRVNFLGLRAVLEAVVDRMPPGSAIVSTASITGKAWRETMGTVIGLVRSRGFDEGRAWSQRNDAFIQEHGGYATAKEAVILYTRDRCLELGRRGIRINAVAPGMTETPMLTELAKIRGGAEFLARLPDPFGRKATPEEQANVLVFLNSSWASYVNGQTIWTDGGGHSASALATLATSAEPGQPSGPSTTAGG
jgi:NAD(P)-dependent dehydrogenase (short-subunit alcohol dehydrogenase family)